MTANPLDHPFRVLHFPQVPCEPFIAPARSIEEACAISTTLANQHLWLQSHDMIRDYSNVVTVEVWDGEEWEEVSMADDFEDAYSEFADAVMAGKP